MTTQIERQYALWLSKTYAGVPLSAEDEAVARAAYMAGREAAGEHGHGRVDHRTRATRAGLAMYYAYLHGAEVVESSEIRKWIQESLDEGSYDWDTIDRVLEDGRKKIFTALQNLVLARPQGTEG